MLRLLTLAASPAVRKRSKLRPRCRAAALAFRCMAARTRRGPSGAVNFRMILVSRAPARHATAVAPTRSEDQLVGTHPHNGSADQEQQGHQSDKPEGLLNVAVQLAHEAAAAGEGQADAEVLPAQGVHQGTHAGADGGHGCRLVARQELQDAQLQRLWLPCVQRGCQNVSVWPARQPSENA